MPVKMTCEKKLAAELAPLANGVLAYSVRTVLSQKNKVLESYPPPPPQKNQTNKTRFLRSLT